MIHKFVNALLALVGKNYEIDGDVPNTVLIRLLIYRSICLLRGIVFFQTQAFIGANVKFRGKNISLGKYSTIGDDCQIDTVAKRKLIIGARAKIGRSSTILVTSKFDLIGKGISIGHDSGIGEFAFFGCAGGIEVGNNVITGQFVSFHSQNHNFDKKNKLIKDQGTTEKGIKIGNNCWIGAKVTFLDGCTISNNTVVAAGSVVKGSFPPNCLIAGTPARIIRYL